MPRIRFPLTAGASAIAVVVLMTGFLGHINLIELPLSLVDRIERNEVDDIVTVVLLVIVAFAVDQVVAGRRGHRVEALEAERLRVVQVTMRTVQDIVNNCLNQLQLVRLDAEGHVADETLEMFDGAIRDAAAQLKALGDLRAYAEEQMAIGTGLAGSRPASR